MLYPHLACTPPNSSVYLPSIHVLPLGSGTFLINPFDNIEDKFLMEAVIPRPLAPLATTS